MSARDSQLNGSAASHASCEPFARLPPATTAASMRSRRAPGPPLTAKIGQSARLVYNVGRLTLDTSISRYASAIGSPSLGSHGAKSLSFAAE
jgi:hypothetical protein